MAVLDALIGDLSATVRCTISNLPHATAEPSPCAYGTHDCLLTSHDCLLTSPTSS